MKMDMTSSASIETGAIRATNSVIWLLCHYPDTSEAEERVERAAQLHEEWGCPIWLYGSSSARYPEAIERLMRRQLISRGISREFIICSGDCPDILPSLDTVQEALNVVAGAKKNGVKTLFCVSNRLQLLQVRALLRREPLHFVWVATRLRDWRWWYVIGRVTLIPLACLGIGPRFAPLIFVRWARARMAAWPF